eukprot:TRINITY_DN26115_c0_g1_i1.p1 TRINITY_DN26115_c0_g1~~TRINITY_DN26115_c0_g1_i1.p1  ORF type:complete len:1197 (+),score=518.41 TRINITY_DN26115_c0_g1_i1:30-3593(+)
MQSNDTGNDGCKVKVAVRVRPQLEKEDAEQARSCTKIIDRRQILLGKDRAFTFDSLFGPESTQQDVFDECVAPLLQQFFKGYNCTILAYGQTGAGKTHTMGTGDLTNVVPEAQGIVPRVVNVMFEHLEKWKADATAAGKNTTYSCKVSYLEIYNETLKDLLRPSTTAKHIQIREDTSGGIVVTGIHEQEVESVEDLMEQLDAGTVSRTTGSTLMNEQSSRSHSILTIFVEKRVQDGSPNDDVTVAKLHLVDLAGSERNKKTQAVGQRFKESISINAGLLALGNVISILGEQSKNGDKKLHVPYRDSKLTRLLQDTLGGNASTVMIACISPADTNIEESLNTLKYANRAKNIRNKPIINKDPHTMLVQQLKTELANCKRLLSLNNIPIDFDELPIDTTITHDDVMAHDVYKQLLVEKRTAEDELQKLKHQTKSHNCWDLLNEEGDDVLRELQDVIGQITCEAKRGQLYSLVNGLERRYEQRKGASSVTPPTTPSMKKKPLGKQQPNTPIMVGRKKTPLSKADTSPKKVSTEELREMVPSSMLLTGQLPSGVTDIDYNAPPHVVSACVDQVISENQKLLRNLKQLEDDLFISECNAVQETEERSKLQSAFATAREENLQLKYKNELLTRQLAEQPVSVEKLKAEIVRIAAEKEALYEAKQRTDAEKKRLEENAREVQAKFQKEHQSLTHQLKMLTVEIDHKTLMVEELVEREKRMNRVKQQNERTIQMMETEKERLKTELDKALKRLDASEQSGDKLDKMRDALRRQYEQRLKEQDESLQGLRRKQRDTQVLLRQHGSDAQKITKLLGEVSTLKTQQSDLKNAIKQKTDRSEAEKDQRDKQLSQLQRQTRQLEAQNVKYSNSLRSKEDALHKLQQQLNVEKSRSKHLAEKQHEIRKEVEKKQCWLDREIEIQKKRREAQERLQRELKRRERILKEREENLFARADMRKAKEQHDYKRLERGLQGWETQINAIQAKLEHVNTLIDKIPSSSRTQENPSYVEATRNLEKLKTQQRTAKEKYDEIFEARNEATELDNQLRQIDDRIDVLQAALEYGEDIIAQTEKEIEDLAGQEPSSTPSSASPSPSRDSPDSSSTREDLTPRDAKQPTPEEYQATLQQYAKQVMLLTKAEQDKDKSLQDMRMQQEDQGQTIEKLRNALKLADMGFNRRLLKVQLEHKKILNKLIVNSGDSS